MTRRNGRQNQKALFKRTLAAYAPGLSSRQLATTLRVSAASARRILYTVRHLANSESR